MDSICLPTCYSGKQQKSPVPVAGPQSIGCLKLQWVPVHCKDALEDTQRLACLQTCAGSIIPDLYTRDDGSGNQRFSLVPVAGAAGQYNVIGMGRNGCANYLSLPSCASGGVQVQFVAGDDGEMLLLASLHLSWHLRGRKRCRIPSHSIAHGPSCAMRSYSAMARALV